MTPRQRAGCGSAPPKRATARPRRGHRHRAQSMRDDRASPREHGALCHRRRARAPDGRGTPRAQAGRSGTPARTGRSRPHTLDGQGLARSQWHQSAAGQRPAQPSSSTYRWVRRSVGGDSAARASVPSYRCMSHSCPGSAAAPRAASPLLIDDLYQERVSERGHGDHTSAMPSSEFKGHLQISPASWVLDS